MPNGQQSLVLKKLTEIANLQKQMLDDWSGMEDFILELTAKKLKTEIRQGRKDYQDRKTISYRKFRKTIKAA